MLSSLTRSVMSVLLDGNGNEASLTSTELGDAIDANTSAATNLTSGATPVLKALQTVSSSGTAALGKTLLVNTSTTAIGLTLPAATAGQWVTVKDASHNAGTNNITITPTSGTIDGAGTLVLASNKAFATLVSDGTNWFQVG